MWPRAEELPEHAFAWETKLAIDHNEIKRLVCGDYVPAPNKYKQFSTLFMDLTNHFGRLLVHLYDSVPKLDNSHESERESHYEHG